MTAPSSVSKSKLKKEASVKAGGKQRTAAFHTGIFFGLLFDPEDGDDMFLRNVDSFPTDNTALYPRR
jgi:hypothetical protein